MIEDDDGLLIKYRVFREPAGFEDSDHPIHVTSGPTYISSVEGEVSEMVEVPQFTFVLKPDSDLHARVALATYAASVRRERPELSSDLMDLLDLFAEDRPPRWYDT